jgi:hypothetical protein
VADKKLRDRQRPGLTDEDNPEMALRQVQTNILEMEKQKEIRKFSLHTKVKINGHTVYAAVDSGATRSVIDPRVVERYNIPHQDKSEVRYVRLGDGSSINYGKGVIRLETKPTTITIAGIAEYRYHGTRTRRDVIRIRLATQTQPCHRLAE